MGSNLRRSRAAGALSASLILFSGCCTSPPPPDPDGVPGGARQLTLGQTRQSDLDCNGGDCADWYRLELQESGDLRLMLSREGDETSVELGMLLADGRARELERRSTSQGLALLEVGDVPSGHYLIRIAGPAQEPVRYELAARLRLPPPEPVEEPPVDPEPQFDVVQAVVLEVEGAVGRSEAVLFDKGGDHGLAPGQRGRLVQDERTIAQIEIVDTYREGSRARIDGSLAEPITPSTIVEIDVPLDPYDVSSDEDTSIDEEMGPESAP